MNKKWKNEKELTRHSASRCGGEGNEVAFLRNARNRAGYNCYRAIFPTGMKQEIKTKIELITSFSPYFPNKTTLVANELAQIIAT